MTALFYCVLSFTKAGRKERGRRHATKKLTHHRTSTDPELPPEESIRRGKLRIRQSVAKIVDAVIERAEQTGSYQHARFLFEFAGITAEEGTDEAPDSLAAVLLERLGIRKSSEESPPAFEGSRDQTPAAAESGEERRVG